MGPDTALSFQTPCLN